VKVYRSTDGGNRIWFDEGEIEDIIESELRKSGFYPTVETPTVDLEGFLEEHLKVSLDQYADLDPDVLGQTEFLRGRAPSVRIDGKLTREAIDAGPQAQPGVLGRWRATVSHEASHIILHRSLFEVCESQGSLFSVSEDGNQPERVRCLKRDVTYGGVGDWREYQANSGMAALMMPRALFVQVAREHCELLGLDALVISTADRGATKLAFGIARVFGVSQQAAQIRLRTLGFVCSSEQAVFAGERAESVM
jgi:hypothetical protein